MTFPLTRSRSRARFFGVPFSPATLFANGEQGAWYDPSDGATIFEDRAGTTPCRVPGAGSGPIPVGLMLDKSKGLVLGPELFSGFTSTGTWTVSGSTYSISAPAASQDLRVDYVGTSGKRYLISFTASGMSGTVFVYPLNTAPYTFGNGQYTIRQLSDAGFFIIRAVAGASATISNISVRELPGNHALAANDTTARPELSARVNLLLRSEEFENAAWVKQEATVTANAAVAPDGTTTADKLIPSVVNDGHWLNQNVLLTAATYTFSFYAKADGYNFVQILNAVSGSDFANFNLSTGVVGSSSGYTPTIEALPNGWYRCSASFTGSATNTGWARIGVVTAANSARGAAFAGDGTSGLFIWGADLRVTNIGANLPAYQRVVDQYTYDNAGFPVRLLANGTSTAMSTAAINFTATDKMTVFAGVRKESASGRAMLTELSAAAVNQGTFNVTAPEFTDDYSFLLTGNAGSPYYQPAGYAAPITNVLACAYDFSGALRVNEIVPRINGVLAQSGGVGTAAGTNTSFLSAPLYLFARNNSSLFLNGSLYSLIVRGAQSTAGEISATEQWVAQKTGIAI